MSFPTSYDPNHPNEAEVPLPNAARIPLASSPCHIELQPPLSIRGHGPGIIAFLAPAPPKGTEKAKTLDPEPIMKWAEEGYAVVGVEGTCTENDTGEALEIALRALKEAKEVDIKDKFACFVYNPALLPAVVSHLSSSSSLTSQISVLVSYGAPVPSSCPIPCIEHLFPSPSESDSSDMLSCPVPAHNFNPYKETRRSYEYPRKENSGDYSAFAVLPEYGDGVYDHSAGALAHTRTLSFLKSRIGGPWFDLERIWDQHTWYEFVGRSVAKTMGTMVAEPYVNHVPTMIGGVGRKDLTAFYRDHFIFANPPDSSLEVVSRTVGIDRIVDEFIFKCNHSQEWNWFLPGVPPTHQDLRVPFIAVVCIRGDRLYHEHIWWDQATALRQCGVLPTHIPYGPPDPGKMLKLPVGGGETADKLLSENRRSNEMLEPGWSSSQ